ELVAARDRYIVVICRSGNRSILACHTLQQMGFNHVASLRTGLKGWNDYDQPMVCSSGALLDLDWVDGHFTPKLRPDQLGATASP
ncbi:MAG: rhodanese-like domain-containing protein, partial [Chromatiales bacterium]|nr:rhodanese-like domain-containing protein [Chromatiales bacterium]